MGISEHARSGYHRFRRYGYSPHSALTGEHIQHVLDGFDDNTTAVRYPTGYILASLFNSISTIGTDYAMRVNHDFYGK